MAEKAANKAAHLTQIEAMLLAHSDGLTQSEIARRMCVHRSTVSRYLPDLPAHVYVEDDGTWRTLNDLSEEEQKKLASGIIAERVNGGHPNAEWIFGDVYELLTREASARMPTSSPPFSTHAARWAGGTWGLSSA